MDGVVLASLKHDYTQDNDCCDSGELGQLLSVETFDGGGGNYLVLKTERWAIDDIDTFCQLLKSVLAQVKDLQ